MNRVIAPFGAIAHPLTAASGRIALVDLARRLIVLGCAAALILAGQSLPF
jgi:hypothetical protein